MDGKPKKTRTLKLACEFCADRIIAARATDAGTSVDACTIRMLSPGIINPDLTNANIVNRNAVATTVVDALTSVGVNSRDVIAIIPDAACRIALLDFDTLPEKPQDAENVVRFRLKKSLPFDVDEARISYQSLKSNGLVQVIAAVVLPSVLDEYESILRDAGLHPGFVFPSTLAALRAIDDEKPTLVVKGSADAVTLAIVSNGGLVLFRRLEATPEIKATPEQLANDIYPSLVFFQDTYGVAVERIVMGGLPSFEEFAPAVQSSTGVPVYELVGSDVHIPGLSGSQRPFVSAILGALLS